jgi:hypothetical protein
LAALAAVLLAGCGGGSSGGTPSAHRAQKCVILQNGNKLCGADARVYCQRFESSPSDYQTAQACQAVGYKTPQQQALSLTSTQTSTTQAGASQAVSFDPVARQYLGPQANVTTGGQGCCEVYSGLSDARLRALGSKVQSLCKALFAHAVPALSFAIWDNRQEIFYGCQQPVGY